MIRNGVRARSPALMPCMATWAARRMSSYEELVQEPMSAALIPAGQPFARTSAASFEIGRSRSGECGPTMWGSSVGEVDLDDLVVEVLGVPEDLGVGDRGARGSRSASRATSRPVRRLEVRRHPLVEGEDGGGGAELRPHVADRALAGRADRLGPGAEVLDDLVGAALDGEEPAEVGDHVLGRGPAGELAGEVDADELRVEHLPRQPGHDLAAVGAARRRWPACRGRPRSGCGSRRRS